MIFKVSISQLLESIEHLLNKRVTTKGVILSIFNFQQFPIFKLKSSIFDFQLSCLKFDFSSFNLTILGIYWTFVELTRDHKGGDFIYFQFSTISNFQIEIFNVRSSIFICFKMIFQVSIWHCLESIEHLLNKRVTTKGVILSISNFQQFPIFKLQSSSFDVQFPFFPTSWE